MLETKHFNGGLNSDDEDRLIANGDYRYALNIRNGDTDNDSSGAVENTKGNTLVLNVNLQPGTNRVIGSLDYKTGNKIYYFVYNSNSNHSVFEYNPVTNTIDTIFEGQLLGFTPESKILSPQVIGGDLYFTDDITEPKCVSIERGRNFFTNAIVGVDNDSFDSPVKIQDILLIQYPPEYPPLNEYFSDQDIDYNNLRGQLFQFKYKYVYYNGQESAWSGISKLPLPLGDDFASSLSQTVKTKTNNVIKVRINSGDSLVKSIKIAVREVGGDNVESTGDFVLWKDISTSYNDSSISREDDYGLVITPNLDVEFNFLNDDVHLPIVEQDPDRLFNNIPYKAKDMCLINGSRLGLFNLEEGNDGVDNPYLKTQVQYNSSLDNNSTTIALDTADADDLLFNGNFYTPITTDYVEYTITRTPSANFRDKFRLDLVVKTILSGNTSQVIAENKTHFFEYDSTFSNNAIALDIAGQMNALYSQTAGGISKIWSFYGPGGLDGRIRDNNYSGITYIDFSVTGSTIKINYKQAVSSGVVLGPSPLGDNYIAYNNLSTTFAANTYYNTGVSFKRGAKHNIGVVYSDDSGRLSSVQVDNSGSPFSTIEDSSFYVNWYDRSVGLEGDVDLTVFLGHTPPDWATKWQFVLSKNRSARDFIQFNSNVVADAGGGLWSVDITTLLNYGINVNANINYTFSKGDRLRFIKDKNGDYFNEYFESEIIKEVVTASTHVIYIRALDLVSSPYILSDFTFSASIPSSTYCTFEIFTPNKDVDKFFYFEIGEKHYVSNPGTPSRLHAFNNSLNNINDYSDQTSTTTAVATLRDVGDVFFKTRNINGNGVTIDELVESYRFSDFYDSFSWNQGRPNIEDKEYKRIRRETTARYSQQFVPETNINGLASFLDQSYETYDWQYGSIQKVHPEDGKIICFQELKIGQIGVNERTIYDSQGAVLSSALTTEENVLNPKIAYYSGEYGIARNPESFAVFGSSKYFTDANQGLVLRLGGDGLTPISMYKMNNYFTDKFRRLNSQGLDFKIQGSYDTEFKEYVIAFEESGTEEAETLTFNEQKNRWNSYWSYKPESIVTSGGGFVSFKDGNIYTHNSNPIYNNFYGVQYNTELTLISNIEPKSIKFYKTIYTESTDVFTMEEATNQFGQSTNLENKADWELKEGVYYAAFLRDVNSGGTFAFPLLEGDNIRCHSMKIKLINDSTNLQKLLVVNIRSEKSMLTNY